MDVTSYLGGNWLTQADLPAPSQVWTIREISQQMVGTDQKICVRFDQHLKLLGLNKTNLKAIAAAYSTDSNAWIGKPVELFRDQTFFQGEQKPCIRVRIPQQQPVAPLAPQLVQPPAQDPPWAGQ